MGSTTFLIPLLAILAVVLHATAESSIFHSCEEVLQENPNSPSGYYRIQGKDSKPVMFCDLSGRFDDRDCSRGWMQVASVDMLNPEEQCPGELQLALRYGQYYIVRSDCVADLQGSYRLQLCSLSCLWNPLHQGLW